MNEYIDKLVERIDAMTLRERSAVMLAVIAVLLVIWQTVLYEPFTLRQAAAQKELNAQKTEIKQMTKKAESIIVRGKKDPNIETRRQVKAIKAEINALDERIARQAGGVVPPSEMARLLETILTQETDLRLVSISSRSSKPLLQFDKSKVGSKKQGNNQQQGGIYIHGMALVIEGSYFSTLKYLKALEEMPWQFYWDGLRITMQDYPKARIRIDVHTLSLQQGWIGV